MKRKLFLVAIAALVIAGAFAPVVASQSTETNSTATPTTSPTPTVTATQTATATPTETATPTPTAEEVVEQAETGPYSIYELKDNGVSQGDQADVKSVRALGDPPRGFVAARYRDPTLINAIQGSDGPWKDIQATSVVQENKIQVYGSAFGDLSGEYTLVIVYWQTGTVKTPNGTNVQYATNQTVDRRTINLEEDELYTFKNVSLRQHLDQTYRVTMWMQRDGEKMDGAQWTFRHRSNPESSSINIDSQAEAWGFTLRNAVIPGVLSLIGGLVLARATLQRTGRGPGYGVVAWMMIVVIVFLVIGAIAYYEIAVILQNIPYVMGLSIGIIAYAAGLTFHQPVQKIGFLRRELNDVIRIPGGSAVQRMSDGGQATMDAAVEFVQGDDGGAELFDEFTEAMFVDLPDVPAVRTDDGYRVPTVGLKPFFARIFADAAMLDLSNIATRQKVREGDLSDIIIVDPAQDEALEHKPARIVRVLPWDTMGDDPTGTDKLIAGVLTLLVTVVPAAAGFVALDRMWNIGSVGFVLGIIATLVLAYSAEDGWIDFDVSPTHYARAEDNLSVLQRALQESKEEQTAKEESWSERATTAQQARRDRMSESKTVTDRLLESLHFGHALPGGNEDDADGFEFEGDDDDDDDDDDPPEIEAK